MKSEAGPPMTLGNAAAAKVCLIVWCKASQYQVEPDPARDGPALWCGHERSRLARATGLFAMRQPAGRYGRDWD